MLGVRWSRYGLVILFFLVVAILRGVFVDGIDGSRPELRNLPTPQATNASLEELAVAPTGGDARPPTLNLSGPLRIEAEPSGNLFVVEDWGAVDETLRLLSKKGELLRTFPPTSAPFARSITDLVASRDRLLVADLIAGAIHTLDRRTDRWTTIQHDPAPYRIEVDRAGDLITMHIGEMALFTRNSASGEESASFGELLVDPEEHSLVLDGFVTRAGKRMIYAGKHLGIIASYFTGGELEYLVQTISNPPIPIVMRGKNRSRSVQRNPLPATLDVTADEETIYHLAPRLVGLRVRAGIDLYKASNGSYYRTFLLPADQKWSSITMGNDALYAAGTQSIISWPKAELSATSNSTKTPTGRVIVLIGPEEKAPENIQEKGGIDV